MSETLEFLMRDGKDFRSARLPSLYSDFRHQRTTNPDGYSANVLVWQNGLTRAARAGAIPCNGDHLILNTGRDLLQALETPELGIPLALDAAMDEAVTRGRMVLLDEFVSSRASIYDRGPLIQPWAIVQWGMNQLGLAKKSTSRPVEGAYVVVDNIEEAGSKIMGSLAHEHTRLDRIMPRKVFEQHVTRILDLQYGVSKKDLRALLVFLSRDKHQLEYNHELVKIVDPGQPDKGISSEDAEIASIQLLLVDLNKQVDQISQKLDALSDAARDAVAAKNKMAAMRYLRSRKLHQDLLVRRSGTLSQVEAAYNKIEEAADHVEVVKAMQATTSVLRALTAQTRGIADVEGVIENLNNELAKVEDIGAVIAETGQSNYAVDEGEIDNELEALEADSRAKVADAKSKEMQKRLEGLGPRPNFEEALLSKKSDQQPLESRAESTFDASVEAGDRMSLESMSIAKARESSEGTIADPAPIPSA